MEPLYRPEGVEARWQETWEAEGLYNADVDAAREPYTIAFPPPNVTGELHMGHALNASIQDALIRWQRMRGANALWQPGYDHAGIATQNVIERELAKEGLTRHDLGREAFLERVWAWLEKYGGVIMGQLRRMGASMDYRRERMTMDEAYVRAVMRFFVHLEVNHLETRDTLYWIRYPLADGSGDLAIATVRPPTMLADTGVAVNPNDDRYQQLIGKEAIVPIVNRRVPIIADERVEPSFGTGALKITPGHDPTDFEIGRDHGLEELSVIGLDSRMNEQAGEFAGLTQDEATERIVARLEAEGLLEKSEEYSHSVGHCDRCGTRIEPLITLQWWVEMKPLAEPAAQAIRDGRVRFIPEQQNDVALNWLDNIRPWCISRQIWWGHRIPVWYCPDGHMTVAETAPEACAECGSTDLTQDEDVLDTWFSSALWPFATLGWPEDTPDLAYFYPNDVNATAREIIFLWEARMIMSGLELMGEEPFHDVLIHSTILAADGRRMSKSLGNGVDPLEMVGAHGADATRYGLLKMSSTQDVRFNVGMIEEGRKLANKLWNVSRLILSNTGDAQPELNPTSVEERWILSRLETARGHFERSIEAYDFAETVNTLYRVTFDDFCDWYAEAIKPRLYDGDANVRSTALAALERLLLLLHPVMPHVTEEIWSNLPARETRLIVAPWPTADPRFDDAAGALQRVQDAAAIFRRSQVLVDLDDEERRIFAAVVKPERVKANGNAQTEIDRLRKEIERAERMLGNARFVENAAPEVVTAEREKLERYSRELRALES
jgi:valyl-tRNA synthetase